MANQLIENKAEQRYNMTRQTTDWRSHTMTSSADTGSAGCVASTEGSLMLRCGACQLSTGTKQP